jgi:hypothetical protein
MANGETSETNLPEPCRDDARAAMWTRFLKSLGLRGIKDAGPLARIPSGANS